MKAREIREGDIVEIDYVTEFTKEHMNEGKALVIWKGFNNQPLVRKLDTKAAIWTCYEHIARVVGHIDIVGYMDRALSAEPCDDCISRQALLKLMGEEPFNWTDSDKELQAVEDYRNFRNIVEQLPSVNPQKTGHWIVETGDRETGYGGCTMCSECSGEGDTEMDYCPNCGARMKGDKHD